ncbi:DUF177 domain-containing protein [Novosphingobium flavum]|uniref:DUF177 domain-containing protein n=1 Tax=Novosphingobium flavum TaxID=1778672 RepID=A0A7X1FS83_9SPHN|nr:DUF177 domain-containing protein [Novosphingobium flavum]MBC2666033.1 DUF177 domain-containing protein [Novosphingobium flavum]
MTPPEFSRPIDRRQLSPAPLSLSATREERAALAHRFALVSIGRLEAIVTLTADGDVVNAAGSLAAEWVQPCAISGEDLPQKASESLALRFVPTTGAQAPDEEVELTAADLDEIEYTGHTFDLGEAIAQSLALAIDPFAAGPEADRARKEAGILGESASGPFAALAGLKLPKE